MPATFQVQVLAEFGDLPQNVDLIVLQQLAVSMEQHYWEVPIAELLSTLASEITQILLFARSLQLPSCIS